MEHIELEQKVMDMLLDGDDDVLKELRNQFLNSSVESREINGAGFYTTYHVKENIKPAANGKSSSFGYVYASYENIEYALSFRIYVKKGYLIMLEGATFQDSWPDDYSKVIPKYATPDGKRDLQELKSIWS
jgi:hypothetical protein